MQVILAYLVKVYLWLRSTWIGTKILNWLQGKLISFVKEVTYQTWIKIKKWWRGEQQAEAKKEYDKVVADPTSTPEDRGKEYEKMHNSGR